ncbi:MULTISPECIES: photosynthetic reaction center cytochrome PufC [unclassified Iodidimonas]|uniref:photosynthetic reaction center cytochrome PufC n=1 Tax=unclassified Iodidimonas TaxID=2626145 RepID=UPI00248281B5|nr:MULTISPECIES: photosynthetic reaction center cytochrome PufC [unclassified Iodidimonas]
MSGRWARTTGLITMLIVPLGLAACDDPVDVPPLDSQQIGYRGTGMEQVSNPRLDALLVKLNEVPPPIYDPVPADGPMATEIYQNVQVLGDLTADQFDRLMAHITEWVAPPEQGCNYCHNPENLADDSVYTKVVARSMISMTRQINSDWGDHVSQTGVTCYSCHRGEPVPANIWFAAPPPTTKMVGWDGGQNHPVAAINYSSLPADPFSAYLLDDEAIRIAAPKALPGAHDAPIQQTEKTYALMIHMSQSLGVNCTFCHNSRSFGDWTQSPPQRTTAWHGIQMTRMLNQDHLKPLTDVFPENRLGPLGDVAKVNCSTCHQGVNKPLLGAPMLRDHPELWGDADFSQKAAGTAALNFEQP